MHQVRISLDHEIKIMVILKTYPDKHGVYLRQVILPFGQDFIELDFCLKGEYDMKKTILITVSIICTVLLIGYICITFIVLPVNSKNRTLTILNDGGGVFLRKITLTYCADDGSTDSYILDLIVEPRYQIPQEYEIPREESESLKLIVDCSYGESFSIECDDAQELYEDGLLIYTTSDLDTTIEIDGVVDYDRYICFKSGRAQKTFVDKAGSLGFVAVDSSPKLKMIQKEWKGYSRVPYDENKWVKQ